MGSKKGVDASLGLRGVKTVKVERRDGVGRQQLRDAQRRSSAQRSRRIDTERDICSTPSTDNTTR